MNCPVCSHEDNHVLSTYGKPNRIVRVRQCDECAHRWRTAEANEEVLTKAERILATATQLNELTSGVKW